MMRGILHANDKENHIRYCKDSGLAPSRLSLNVSLAVGPGMRRLDDTIDLISNSHSHGE